MRDSHHFAEARLYAMGLVTRHALGVEWRFAAVLKAAFYDPKVKVHVVLCNSAAL